MTEQQCPGVAEPNPFSELIATLETMGPETLRAALREFLESQPDAEAGAPR